jgi:hypothetical protein
MEDLTITGYIAKFRATKNILFLVKAITLVLRQKRSSELIYGAYCSLFFRPSLAKKSESNHFLRQILSQKEFFDYDKLSFSRSQLIELWGQDFNVHSLPNDFEGARSESIVQEKKFLVVGEYAEHLARVAYITRDSCFVSDYYNQVPGVRHIHSILRYGNSGEILIATGDSCKLLDLWVVADEKLSFVKRIKTYFAGYTASINVNGHYYFGTDFSNRPNYIETLEGEKYFFPEPAYKMSTVAFHSFLDRYIVAISCDMPQFGDRKALSVFDVIQEEFVFCAYLDCILKNGI